MTDVLVWWSGKDLMAAAYGPLADRVGRPIPGGKALHRLLLDHATDHPGRLLEHAPEVQTLLALLLDEPAT